MDGELPHEALSLQITGYVACSKCSDELTRHKACKIMPASMSALPLQVWCRRHKANIVHIDFQAKNCRLIFAGWKQVRNASWPDPALYMAITDTAEKYDITFPLHLSTEAPMRVHQLLGVWSAAKCGAIIWPMVMYCRLLAMALAVRARMIASDPNTTTDLARDLLEAAIQGVLEADVTTPPIGRA